MNELNTGTPEADPPDPDPPPGPTTDPDRDRWFRSARADHRCCRVDRHPGRPGHHQHRRADVERRRLHVGEHLDQHHQHDHHVYDDHDHDQHDHDDGRPHHDHAVVRAPGAERHELDGRDLTGAGCGPTDDESGHHAGRRPRLRRCRRPGALHRRRRRGRRVLGLVRLRPRRPRGQLRHRARHHAVAGRVRFGRW